MCIFLEQCCLLLLISHSFSETNQESTQALTMALEEYNTNVHIYIYIEVIPPTLLFLFKGSQH